MALKRSGRLFEFLCMEDGVFITEVGIRRFVGSGVCAFICGMI